MKRLLTFLLVLIGLAVSGSAAAQMTTQGTDFWVNFLPNYQAGYSTTVYLSAKDACSGTLTNPSTGYSTTFSVAANSVTPITIAIANVVTTAVETASNAAVHIVSTDTISVSGLNYIAYSTDASFFVPTQSLGINYRIASFTPLSTGYPSQIGIWAVEDSTDIEIITTQNSTGAFVAGTPRTIRLNKGQSYLITSNGDLTGSSVRATKSCTPIGVSGGVACANVPVGCIACNHLFEQMLPIETWGKSFFVAPTRNKSTDYFRILAHTNGTSVQVGATTYSLNAGQMQTFTISNSPTIVTSNQPVAVIGYSSGGGCTPGSWGDPTMYWVSPTEQTLTDLVFNTVAFAGIDSQYVNIMVKTADTGRVYLNGSKISQSFVTNASTPNYAYAQIKPTTVTNRITCDSGFLAIVYGYGSYNSYAYSAGSSLRGVEKGFIISGKVYTDTDTLGLCYGKSYPFEATDPYNNLTNIFWDFGDGDTITAFNPSHTYTTVGLHNLKLYTQSSGSCATNIDTILGYVRVRALAVIPRTDTTLCAGDSVTLYATGVGAITAASRYFHWYNGSTYVGQGQPKVSPTVNTQYMVVFTDSCATMKDTGYVNVNITTNLAVTLNPDTTICRGRTVQLHASLSSPASGITYTWTGGINGTGFTDSLVTPTANTLYAIKISGNCIVDSTDSVQVTLRPVLGVSLRPDTTICIGQSVNLNATGTGGDSTYIFTWNNGLGTGVSKTVSPTTTTTYRVIISDGCTVTPDTAFTTIYVRPALDVTLTADTTLCRSQSVNLAATGTGGDSSYTFTWNNSLGTGTSKLVSPAGTTQYQVIISDACTVKPDTAYVNVTVRAALDVTLRSDTTICRGQSVNLNTLTSGGRTPYTLTWDNGLGTGTAKIVSPAATTTYRVILSDGCSPNDTAYTTVNVRPALDVTLRSDTTICIGQSVNLNATGAGGDSSYTYTWDNGLGTGVSQTVSPNTTTTYRVIISDGCTVRPDTAYTTVRVRPALDVTLRSDTTICKGRFVALLATGRGGDSSYTFTWNHGLGTGISKFVNPDTTTTYRVIINDACTSREDTAYTKVYVRPPLDITLRPDTMICNGQTVNITAQGYGGDSSYTFTWNHGLGTGVTQIVAPSITTIYEVIIRDGCTIVPDTAITIVNVRMGLQLAMGQTDTTICQGGSVTLWGTPGGGDSSYTYNWLPVSASTSTLNVSPDTTTQYAMILGDACTVEPDTQWMTIYVRPNPELGISNDTTICIGGTADMLAWGSGGDSSYVFTWTGIGTGASTQVNPVSTRSYQVILSDQCSVMGDTAYITVNVRPALDATIRPDTTICTGQSVNLWTIARGGDSSYSYTWNQGLGNTSNENVIPTATTTYRMILGDGCTQRNDTVYTTVFVRPPLGIRMSRDTSICEGESVLISAVGSGGDSSYNYTWNQGVGNGASHLVTPAATTIYRVDLDDNCSPGIQGQVTVSVEQKPVMSFAPTPAGVCLGDSIFFDNQTAGSTNYSYIWRFGDTRTSTQYSPTYAYKNAGTFNVVLVAVSALCRDSVNRPVNVYPNPVARFTPSPAVTDLRKPEITFNNQSTLGNSYDWDFGDMMGGSSAEDPQYSYTDTGWYVTTLTVRSINNCVDTAMRTIRINDYYTFFAPNAFSPNDNKNNDLFEVKGHGWVAYRISIYNRWGEKVFESEDPASPWNGEVQKRGVKAPEGLYYYYIEILDVFKKRHFYEGSITLLK